MPNPMASAAGKSLAQQAHSGTLVLGRYSVSALPSDVLGEGTSSICRKGVDVKTGASVAVKSYKLPTGSRRSSGHSEVTLLKFRRQIKVLQMLQEPFQPPAAGAAQPALPNPSKLFLRLLDYTKDAHGEPGPDPADGTMYVVTELAQYSLKDFIKLRREEFRPLSEASIQNITKAIVLVVAGLHAKGLVHLDLKPENLMVFDGRVKLIDVDGCVAVGTSVPITDSSLSFSPCYCAPEWAAFLVEDSDEPRITISPALDVWSVGMTICELITLEAALRATYASYMRHGRSRQEASYLFLDWLSRLQKPPLPPQVRSFVDHRLVDLLQNYLLVPSVAKRASLAQALLSAPYLREGAREATGTATSRPSLRSQPTAAILPAAPAEDDQEAAAGSNHVEGLPTEAPREVRQQPQQPTASGTAAQCLLKGTLWMLSRHGDPKDPAAWKEHDTWITPNGSLCYFSNREGKCQVLLDANRLATARVTKLEGGARQPAFIISSKVGFDLNLKSPETAATFACRSEEEFATWVKAFQDVRAELLRTMQLGKNMAQEIRNLKLQVKNRRLEISPDDAEEAEPILRTKLWKLRSQGNRLLEKDWFQRDMWLSQHGSLCYWSEREGRPLMYYTTEDIARASFTKVPSSDCVRPWVFQICLPPVDGLEFVPGEFAADSEEELNRWISELEHVSKASRHSL